LKNISEKAILGNNVTIEDFVTIGDNVIIGDNVQIGAGTYIYDGARISSNVNILNNVTISAPPQHLGYKNEETFTYIGEGSEIREYVTIHRGTVHSGKTVIGKNCYMMALSHVGHDCSVGDNVIITNLACLAGHVNIGNGVVISASVLIQQFCSIGDFVMLGGHSGINKDVPPYIMATFIPARYQGVNKVGLRRNGFNMEKIEEIKDIYKIIYLSGYNISDAVRKIRDNYEIKDEIKKVIDFIENSKRGIIKGPEL
jgi:UDP-N-acetylglucosamine acyltransferase